MASKKDKLLESAQRFLLKGQLDKAIKDYQQVVALEPNDIRNRQRLAELLVRDNRREEAISQYEDIGKHYADNSYFLKAIAIYKQIQRLSPANTSVALTIASLNHQQGLNGNALAEYGQVVAQYEKEGALKDALKVVEKMLGVDAAHAATRLKHAELLFATGAKDPSREAFVELLNSLRTRGQDVDADAVAARVAQLFPDHQPTPAAIMHEEEHLALDGFAEEEVPGVAVESPAPWVAEEPTPLAEDVAGAPELPDAFAQPIAAPQPPPVTEPVAAGPGPDSWEEEIQLDLDDDFPLEFASTPDPGNASPAVPEPVSFEAPDAFPAEPDAQAEEGVDLHLDFAVELDFDEVVQSIEDEPAGEDQHGVVELELPEEEAFELNLSEEPSDPGEASWLEPAGSAGAGFPWEPEGAEHQLEPPELPELEELPEELPEEQPAAAHAALPAELPWGEPERTVRGWEEIYPDHEAGEELDIEELESHYDLGIGYKEMGMYAGAIKEFDFAARNAQRRLDCLCLQAVCFREKGEPSKAEELLRRGLSLDVLSKDERICLSYELAVQLEATGAVEEAIALYREVRRENSAYHDVSRRLSALSGEDLLDIIDLEMEEA